MKYFRPRAHTKINETINETYFPGKTCIVLQKAGAGVCEVSHNQFYVFTPSYKIAGTIAIMSRDEPVILRFNITFFIVISQHSHIHTH